jgi:hypothetical protein
MYFPSLVAIIIPTNPMDWFLITCMYLLISPTINQSSRNLELEPIPRPSETLPASSRVPKTASPSPHLPAQPIQLTNHIGVFTAQWRNISPEIDASFSNHSRCVSSRALMDGELVASRCINNLLAHEFCACTCECGDHYHKFFHVCAGLDCCVIWRDSSELLSLGNRCGVIM